MRVDRRTCALFLGLCAMAPVTGALAASRTVVDTVGRRVTLAGPVTRIVLLDALDVLTMAVLHPDPSRLVVGWAAVDTFDSDLVRGQYDVAPGGGTIPVVGGQAGDTVSVERILALQPDLVVTTVHMEPGLGDGMLARRLEAAGIPLIFSNAASNRRPATGAIPDPFDDVARALRMWGVVLDRSERAEAFLAFVRERFANVAERLGAVPPTTAYLEVQSTYDDCCWAAGRRIWGDLLARAGGRSLAAADAPWYAKLAVEQVIAETPAVYIASGGAFGAGIRPGIGPGLDPATARAGLRRLVGRTGLHTVPAVRNGRVHGVWTGLLTSLPLNVLFVEAAAKWLHPALFADLDPARTLDEINRRFLAKPLPGPCWLTLTDANGP